VSKIKQYGWLRDRLLFMGGGREKRRGGGHTYKYLTRRGGGAIKFFQENEGEVAITFEGICLISLVSIWLYTNVATKSWSLI
jgi:hypothetical protein